ncbi:zinc finger BED domain-containing protein RICESLEEPER 2 [Tanacetum coccineum]
MRIQKLPKKLGHLIYPWPCGIEQETHFPLLSKTPIHQKLQSPWDEDVSGTPLVCLPRGQSVEAGQTSMGRDGQIFMYNPDYLREQFASLVIQRGLPFNHFDHEQTTRVFQNTLQPRYTHDFATFDVLGFWKAKENQFPVLSRMAMDILSVQASFVLSEVRIFNKWLDVDKSEEQD